MGWALKKKKAMLNDPWEILTTMPIKPIKFLSPFINRQAENRLTPLESVLIFKLRDTAF